jgi:hypothetical protein
MSNLTLSPVTFINKELPQATAERFHQEYSGCYWNPLPTQIFQAIQSDPEQDIIRSWKSDCPLPAKKLAYIQVRHWNFKDKLETGELIVNVDVTEEILDIFREQFESKFPIEKMQLIDSYDADDDRSMSANNSSAFCSRAITAKPGAYSKHSFGTAIDINPLQNPYINEAKKIVAPTEGKKYEDRSLQEKGMITKESSCYKSFNERGWKWGGNWNDPIDYQHFEKDLFKKEDTHL